MTEETLQRFAFKGRVVTTDGKRKTVTGELLAKNAKYAVWASIDKIREHGEFERKSLEINTLPSGVVE